VAGAQKADSLDELHVPSQGVYFLRTPFTVDALIGQLRAARLGEGPDESHRPPSARTEPKVLLVAPDADLLEWVQLGLRRKGVVCAAAADVGEAVEMARGGAPDAIFVDADAPAASADLVEQLHASPATHDVPVWVMAGARTDGREPPPNGAAGVLRKPFGIDDLAAIVEQQRRLPVH